MLFLLDRQERTAEEQTKTRAKLANREKGRKDKIKAAGIDYDYEGFVSVLTPVSFSRARHVVTNTLVSLHSVTIPIDRLELWSSLFLTRFCLDLTLCRLSLSCQVAVMARMYTCIHIIITGLIYLISCLVMGPHRVLVVATSSGPNWESLC
jgi:hypothetical protein